MFTDITDIVVKPIDVPSWARVLKTKRFLEKGL